MNFPEWAPPKLVDIYLNLYARRESSFIFKRKEKILIALTTKPEMERVWKMLYKRRRQYPIDLESPKCHGDEVMALSLFHEVERAVLATNNKFSTRTEDVKKYQDIAKSARLLARKVRGLNIDLPLLEWLPIQAVNTMLEKDINQDKAEGFFCLMNDESEFHRKGGIYEVVRLTDKKSGDNVIEYWRAAENTNEFFCRYIVTPQYPCISNTLESLAEKAEKQAEHEAVKIRLSDKETTSKKTIFIRALFPYWREKFGGPLKRTLAKLCEVVLDEETTLDDVDNAIKNYKISI